jgi:TRAP transporter 4TM/12TM fusion protein
VSNAPAAVGAAPEIADSEGAEAKLPPGALGWVLAAACFGLAAYALYWTQFSVNTTVYRASFLGAVLALCFLFFPQSPSRRIGPAVETALAALVAFVLLGFVASEAKLFEWSGPQGPLAPALVESRRQGLVIVALASLAFLISAASRLSGRLAKLRAGEWLFAGLVIAASFYLCTEIEAYKTRPTRPAALELALGATLILAALEATRRAVGWILPTIALVFLVYCHYGPLVPEPFDHRGFSLARIVGQNFLTLEGLFSTPTDVAATFIILFTIYGAVLEKGGAGKFFIDWAFALFGKKQSPSAPARATVASGFLLGTVSGSGVATTVTISSLAWPMLRQSGYPGHVAGGLLSAAGIGATLSPPTLGAAAFIIAEYLKLPYLQILIFAAIPTLLYYLSCWLMAEGDARRLGIKPMAVGGGSALSLTLSQGYHFLSIAAIAVALILGFSSFMAVYWSIVVAIVLSMIRPESRLVSLPAFAGGAAVTLACIALAESGAASSLGLSAWIDGRLSVSIFWGLAAAMLIGAVQWVIARAPEARDPAASRGIEALSGGARQVLGIAATCATAGVIVSVVNLTGLGLTISGLIVDGAGGTRIGVILLAALAMWVLGTAIPVTASYIIAAVMLAPALIQAGVPEPAAHMFLFYYAVLADVSPPTALAPFAAAAIVKAGPFQTMFQAWKYTLPAFLVPVMFCLTPGGLQLLMLTPEALSPVTALDWLGIARATLTACFALGGLAFAATGHAFGPMTMSERLLAAAGGLLLLGEGAIALELAGAVLLTCALALHILRRRQAPRV